MQYLLSVLFLAYVATSHTEVAAFDVPALSGPVVDQVGVVDSRARQVIEKIIRDVNARDSAQIQVLLVRTLDGEPIEQVALKVVEKWQLGTAKKDNGILFLAAIEDRRMRIEVGQGLEGDVPDVIAKRIIADQVTPFFRAGRYSEGVIVAVSEIARRTDPVYAQSGQNLDLADQASAHSSKSRRTSSNKSVWGQLIPFAFILIFSLLSGLSRRHRRTFWGAGGWPGGGSGGGGWSSGGGGWSGGGGGFSGGGASGSW